MDNHAAHRSKQVAELLDEHFRAFFMPAYSSPFNPQETVWSLLKRVYYVRLHRRTTNITTMEQFERLVVDLYTDVTFSVENILRSNKRYLDFHADLDIFDEVELSSELDLPDLLEEALNHPRVDRLGAHQELGRDAELAEEERSQ